jgi:hypothetical protein
MCFPEIITTVTCTEEDTGCESYANSKCGSGGTCECNSGYKVSGANCVGKLFF